MEHKQGEKEQEKIQTILVFFFQSIIFVSPSLDFTLTLCPREGFMIVLVSSSQLSVKRLPGASSAILHRFPWEEKTYVFSSEEIKRMLNSPLKPMSPFPPSSFLVLDFLLVFSLIWFNVFVKF